MRVLHVVKKFPDLIGGDATAVSALGKAQANAGHEVFVVTSNVPDVRASASVFRVGPPQRAVDLDRITWKRVRTTLAAGRWSRTAIPRIRPDVIHSHSPDLGYAIASEARRRGIRRVHTCHGLWFPVWGPRSLRGRAELALLRGGRYDAIATVNRSAEKALRSEGFQRVVHVPNGVDTNEFDAPRRTPDTCRFLFVGRHEPQKGPDLFLAAASVLQREWGSGFEFVLVGSGSMTSELRRRATALGLVDVVRFTGRLERPSVVAEYLRASAFVLPSRFEGFPIAILEAWAAGLPVIAASVGGVEDVCGTDNAVLVPPGDVAALAAAMATLAHDDALRERLGSMGRRLVRERFGWDAVSRRYLELYEPSRAVR